MFFEDEEGRRKRRRRELAELVNRARRYGQSFQGAPPGAERLRKPDGFLSAADEIRYRDTLDDPEHDQGER